MCVALLTSQTVSPGGLAAFRGKTCSLELRRDGTFVATNVPPAQTGLPPHNFMDALVSGSGTWRIDRMGSVDDKTRWGVCLDTPTARFEAVGLSGAKPPYGLIYTMGDPDSDDVLCADSRVEWSDARRTHDTGPVLRRS